MNYTETEYYLTDSVNDLGPVSLEEAIDAIRTGQLNQRSAKIWQEGMENWVGVFDFPPLGLRAPPRSTQDEHYAIKSVKSKLFDGNLACSLGFLSVSVVSSKLQYHPYAWNSDLSLYVTVFTGIVGFIWFIVFLATFLSRVNRIDSSIGVFWNLFLLLFPLVNLIGWFLVPLKINKKLSDSSGCDFGAQVRCFLAFPFLSLV